MPSAGLPGLTRRAAARTASSDAAGARDPETQQAGARNGACASSRLTGIAAAAHRSADPATGAAVAGSGTTEISLGVEYRLDPCGAVGPDQLVFQVIDADVKAQALKVSARLRRRDARTGDRSPEDGFLADVAEAGKDQVRAARTEPGQVPGDGVGSADRQDHDAFSRDIHAMAGGESFERDLVADAFDEHGSTGVRQLPKCSNRRLGRSRGAATSPSSTCLASSRRLAASIRSSRACRVIGVRLVIVAIAWHSAAGLGKCRLLRAPEGRCGAWHLRSDSWRRDVGWYWHLVQRELRSRGHRSVAPDLPCEDDSAGLPEYADTVVQAVGDHDDVVVVASRSAASRLEGQGDVFYHDVPPDLAAIAPGDTCSVGHPAPDVTPRRCRLARHAEQVHSVHSPDRFFPPEFMGQILPIGTASFPTRSLRVIVPRSPPWH